MKKIQRDFKGIWMPKEIYLAEDLSWTQKILLVEIDSLDKGDGCFASNKYFSVFLHKSEGQIANAISELRKKGWLIDRKFDGRKRYISLKADFRKTLRQTSGKPEGRVQENLKHINIINNTINNNTHKQKVCVDKWTRLSPEKQLLVHKLCYHLEDELGTKIVNWGKQTRAASNMKKAGYTIEEIKKTITYMAKKDPFFADKGFDLMTVSNNISRYKAMANKRNNQ